MRCDGRWAGSVVALTLAVACNSDAPTVASVGSGSGRLKVRILRQRTTSVSAPAGFTPSDLASAYNLDTTLEPNVTIGIAAAYGYANAESDLAAYRSQFGLPACTVVSGCLTLVNQEGNASPLPGPPPQNDDWTLETAYGLDMASATCPHCKLLVLEADNDQGNGLFEMQSVAANLGAAVMVDAFGAPESSIDVSLLESYFNVPGLSIFAAGGVDGYSNGGSNSPDYPASSAYVIAVGGTTLATSTNSRGWAETAWSEGGSGCSSLVAKPAYQGNTGCGNRAIVDVSAVSDPNTGVAIYNAGAGGFSIVGGSGAAAIVAGIFALTGQAGQTAALAYQHPEAFYDITSGSNGTCGGGLICTASAGWDGPTGIGTPNGRALALIRLDAGVPDAGVPDAGMADAGTGVDAGSGSSPADAGTSSGSKSSGGGCSSGGGGPCLAALFVLGLFLAQRRQAPRA
jgi:subtilase family serine protease